MGTMRPHAYLCFRGGRNIYQCGLKVQISDLPIPVRPLDEAVKRIARYLVGTGPQASVTMYSLLDSVCGMLLVCMYLWVVFSYSSTMSFSKCIFRNNDMNATTIATMKQISATFDRNSNVESVSRRFMGKYKPKILSVNLQSDSLHQTFLAHTILFYTE